VILNKIKLDLLYLQEELVISLELKFCINFYILMALIIYLELTSYVLKDINYYLNKNYQQYGQHQIIYTEWEI